MDFLAKAREVALTRSESLREPPLKPWGFRDRVAEKARGEGVALVLEFKRCSPRGFTSYVTPAEFLERVRGAASALSVLVEPYWFCGSLELLPFFIPHAPVLAKDLVVGEAQVEAHAQWGASATLLILDLLGWGRLGDLYEHARSLGLDVVIEVSRADEAVDAMHSFPESIVGVNTRNLRTLELSPSRALRELRKAAEAKPEGALLMAESGVDTLEKARAFIEAGADALLIGTWVMRDPEAVGLLGRLLGGRVLKRLSKPG